jgi:low temperature requirement protein LtrA
LNAADTSHPRIQLATLVATGFAFFMAISVPQSFTICSWWFAISYVAVRSIGLLVYLWVTWPEAGMRNAVKTFGAFSLLGLMAVIAGGFLGGTLQYWLWGLAIVLDVFAASVGGNNEAWNLHPRHFAERHGLFVIIALGETLIVAASAVSGDSLELDMVLVSALAVGITSSLWWLYFFRIKDQLEHAMAQRSGAAQSTMARDTYSLFHFPMICGLIVYAYAIEEAMLHPADPLSMERRLALASGIFLYSFSIVIAYWRATGKFLKLRTGLTIAIALIIVLRSDIIVFRTLVLCLACLVLICMLEEKVRKESSG